MSTPVRITKQDLEQKVHEGWKKDALAEHYNLPVSQMTKVLQEADLRIRRFHRPKFVLVDESEENTSEEVATVDEVVPNDELPPEEASEEQVRTEESREVGETAPQGW